MSTDPTDADTGPACVRGLGCPARCRVRCAEDRRPVRVGELLDDVVAALVLAEHPVPSPRTSGENR